MKKKRTDLELSVVRSAIGIIFNHDEYWLGFFYSHKHCELRLSHQELLAEALCYSPSQQVMIKTALDLWTECGYTNLIELIKDLDHEDLMRAMLALLAVREITLQDLDDMRLSYEA